MVRRVVLILGVIGSVLATAPAQDCSGPSPGPRTLLKFDKAIFAGTVTEEKQASGLKRFRVTEAFKGVTAKYVDLIEMPDGIHFEVGKQYLVFANSCFWEPSKTRCLTSLPCGDSRELNSAQALVEQLRAEKGGKPVASVYGMLWRYGEGDRHPISNVIVKLRDGDKSFETRTDERGAYAFARLPKGTYAVSANLPANFAVADLILRDPVPSFDLPSRSSLEYDIYALPTGRISGMVIGPDGKQLRSASVELYRLSRYEQGNRGLYSFQGEPRENAKWEPFDFYHLPADDYVLVFNPTNDELPDSPFPRTFFPHAADLENAQVIHLAEGQQILDADIHLSNPLPTRKVTVKLAWPVPAESFYPPSVMVKADVGRDPYPVHDGQDTYTLNLLWRNRYTIRAEAFCRRGKGKVETDAVTVSGSDPAVSQVILTFDKSDCGGK